MSYTGLILPLGVLASVAAWNLARYKGLNEQRWAVLCLVFFPALLALIFIRGHQRPGDTAAFRERWTTLSAYDPDIKAGVERMAALGPAAVDKFRLAYADVQTKEAIPLILADLETRWAAGDRFDGAHARAARLAELHRQGRLSERDYKDQARRLRARTPRSLWAGLWWKVPLLLTVVWMVWPRGGPATGIPECTDAAARELVRRVIEDGANAKLQNFRLITLEEFRQVVYSAEAQERHCAATALLNAGRRRISWGMYRREGKLIAEVYGL